MRILYVTNERLNKKGGTPLRNKEISKELIDLGHSVYYMAPRFGLSKPEGDWSIPLIQIPLPPRSNFSFLLYEMFSPLIVFFLALFLRVDVVFNTGTMSSACQYLACKILRRKYVIEINGVADCELESRGWGKLRTYLFKRIYRGVYRSADYFICVASGIKDELTKRWPPFENRSITIPNAANDKMFYPRDKKVCREEVGLPHDKFIIGFVGLLCPWHGVSDLITASKILVEHGHKDFLTVIVGGGDMESELKSLVDEYNLHENVLMTGRVKHDLVPIYNCAFDLAGQVHNDPVIGNLGNSMKFWEYLSSGVPVVVSDMSEACRRVVPGLIGWQFHGGDAGDLALKIEIAMKSPEKCREIGKANSVYVANGYTWKKISREISGVLENLSRHNV